MSLITAEVGLTAIRRIADLWSHVQPDSLVDYTKVLRVEPIALIDQDCVYHDGLYDVMQSLQAMFSGYYLQAVAVSTTVGNIAVRHHLDKLNPDRSAVQAALNTSTVSGMMSTEAYEDALPVPHRASLGLEALDDAFDSKHLPPSARQRVEQRRAQMRGARQARREGVQTHDGAAAFGRDTVKDLHELANLSVGKMLEVTITDGQHNATVPVAVRLLANALPSTSLVHILSHGTEDTSMKERWHAWRSGRLEFWKDLVLCNDLIDAHRRDLMRDKDGLFSTISSRKRQGTFSGIISGQPSVGMASNLVVMSSQTAETLEVITNYQLKNFQQRQKIFNETAIMIMAVLDKQWERVTFYTRGIPTPTQLGMRDLKAANKGNGPDVGDILRAYQLGASPSL